MDNDAFISDKKLQSYILNFIYEYNIFVGFYIDSWFIRPTKKSKMCTTWWNNYWYLLTPRYIQELKVSISLAGEAGEISQIINANGVTVASVNINKLGAMTDLHEMLLHSYEVADVSSQPLFIVFCRRTCVTVAVSEVCWCRHSSLSGLVVENCQWLVEVPSTESIPQQVRAYIRDTMHVDTAVTHWTRKMLGPGYYRRLCFDYHNSAHFVPTWSAVQRHIIKQCIFHGLPRYVFRM